MQLHVSNILTPDGTYLHYYCSIYLAASAGQDPVSYSMIKFKQSIEPDQTEWINAALTAIAETNPARLPEPDIIVRALHHDETSAPAAPDTTPLDRLGTALAKTLQAVYLPQLIHKHAPTIPLRGLKRPDREEQTRLSYQAAIPPNLLNVRILLIDDILTTGSTAAAILHTLSKAGADPIGIFTLAKALP